MPGTPPPPPPPPERPTTPPPSAPPPPPPGVTPPPPGGFGAAHPPTPPLPVVQPAPGSNGMAVASLVLGIVSLPLCFLFIPALLAVIFGFVALSQIKQRPQSGRNQAIAGLVMGSCSLAIIVLAIIFGDWETSFETGAAFFAA